MPLSVQHRHALLLADRTHDVGVITIVVTEVLAANPDTNLLEIEQAFRDNTAAVATTEGFEVVLGLLAMLAAVGKAGVTSAENRAALAGKPPATTKLIFRSLARPSRFKRPFLGASARSTAFSASATASSRPAPLSGYYAAGQRGSASLGERSRSPRSSIPTGPNHSVRLNENFYR